MADFRRSVNMRAIRQNIHDRNVSMRYGNGAEYNQGDRANPMESFKRGKINEGRGMIRAEFMQSLRLH